MINNDGQEEQLNTLDESAQESIVPDTNVKKKRGKAEVAINVALWIAIAVLLVAVILRMFVFNTVGVSGLSMTPTYADAEVVTVNKVKKAQRGDVVVFYKNEIDNKFAAQFAKPEQCTEGQPYEKLIKRVIALSGDRIWAQCIQTNGANAVYEIVVDTADGNRLFEDYYVKKGEALNKERYYIYSDSITNLGILENCTEDSPFVVSDGCFFAMGDNRANSKDSRFFGEFKLSQLFGVVLDK